MKNIADKKIDAKVPEISGKRKIIFYFISALIPLLLLLLLELSLHISGYGSRLDLFVKSRNYPGYYEINQDVGRRYFSKFKKTSPSNDIFLIDKPENCYRVFVMGCSTTRGFPYSMGMTFSRILNYRLQDAFPEKRIEVVNTAMTAVNSNTQLDFIDEILEMKPDAILIYTGHNEYYGALGVASVENGGNALWIKRLHLSLIKFRTYQLVQKMVGRITTFFVIDKSKPTATLMENIVKDKAIPFNSDIYYAGIEQFKINMDEVIERIKDARVPVIFSEAVSNISGNPPFKSIQIDGFPTATEVFENAVKLEAEGKCGEALKMYYLAKDLDGVRFRAPEELNKVIHEIGVKYSIPVLGMNEVFGKASPNGIIGNSLMTEHLHPNIDGYFLMADAFFKEMQQNQFIAEEWDTLNIMPSNFYRQNWGFTELDSLVADLNIKALKSGWPFKSDSVINNFIYTYKPTSMVDSIAHMCVLYDNISIAEKHRDLAKIYIGKGEKVKAFSEYYALIKYSPYNSGLYYEALQLLFDLHDFNKALTLMLSMPGYDSNFFANYQIGKIYQELNEHKLALQSFKKAKEVINKNDNLEIVLIAQYNSYQALQDSVQTDVLLKEIRQINPGFTTVAAKNKEVVIYLDKEVRDLIQEAMKQARQQNLTEAIALLEKSLKIKETPFALQMMGSVFFQLKDARALSFLERAYKLDSGDINTIHNLFVLYLGNKDFKLASQMLEEYKLLSPDNDKIKIFSNSLAEEMRKNK